MTIYFHVNPAFSLPDFMTYGASLWDTIRLLHLPLLLLISGDFRRRTYRLACPFARLVCCNNSYIVHYAPVIAP
ncbi:MAG: hypothetical protein BECKG1743D_GA0114223_100082 [Candidatus Kentron sp. G]|nr:MAG: hypothetical protein BECKG1743F_GA0114225_100099 [Candidatus Kentron sp. G]VFM95435.1 MAG: hypothetical protein BECKG1743E_GA0114224_1000314 [Candidatus Kentron sp. G]VFM97339.1 MAG: hypothetical protein BECKG1743D_GA0114223_100082 [Candidatus Kentron sp. G]